MWRYSLRFLWLLGMSFTASVQASTLTIDDDVTLLALDGKVIKDTYLIPRELASGEHQLVIRYEKRLHDGGREVDYKTPPLVMMVNFPSNEDIKVLAPVLNSKSQADLYFEKRSMWRIQYQSGPVKTVHYERLSAQDNLPKEAIQSLLSDYNKANGYRFATEDKDSEDDKNELLKSIQLLYIQANEEQRKAIKSWLLKQ